MNTLKQFGTMSWNMVLHIKSLIIEIILDKGHLAL